MRGGVVEGIRIDTGQPATLKLDPDGQLLVTTDEDTEESVGDLLKRLIWEVAALRMAYCDATDQLFKEFPEK
jgi:hypothetical protein